MSKYQLLICPLTEDAKRKIINNQDPRSLICRDGGIVDIMKGRDSGADMFFAEDTFIYPGDTKLIGLGVKCKMVHTNTDDAVGFYLYPRSSIYKTPLRLANSVGIIDAGYRGEIKAPLTNSPNISNYINDSNAGINVLDKYAFEIKKGSRYVQICAPDLSPFSIKFVENLDSTERGSGGFGSTGVN